MNPEFVGQESVSESPSFAHQPTAQSTQSKFYRQDRATHAEIVDRFAAPVDEYSERNLDDLVD